MQRLAINFNVDPQQLVKVARFLRRFSAAWVLAVIIFAFIGASGLSLYCSFAFLPVNSTKNRPNRVQTGAETLVVEGRGIPKADIDAIIARNIFNSEGKVGDSIDGPGGAKKASDKILKSDLPLKLIGVIFSGDPYNGLAMIENTSTRKTVSYVVGDKAVDDATVYQIFDDRVILERAGGSREFLELGRFELVSNRRKSTGKASSPNKGALTASAGEFKEDGFERKENVIKLTEEFKRNLLTSENLSKILQDAKAEPNIVGGQVQGFRLTRIKEGSVYEKAGFVNNDIVEEINGIPLRDAGNAIRLLNQIKTVKDIEVRILRGGQVTNMSIQVQ